MGTKKFLGSLALGVLIGGALGLFCSPANGKKNREDFHKTAKKVSETLIKEFGKLKNLSQKEYEAIVENVIKKHSREDLMTGEGWTQIMDELKVRWKDVQKELKKKTPATKKKPVAKKK